MAQKSSHYTVIQLSQENTDDLFKLLDLLYAGKYFDAWKFLRGSRSCRSMLINLRGKLMFKTSRAKSVESKWRGNNSPNLFN